MFYFTSDFSVFSVFSDFPGKVSLSVSDVVSGDIIFANSYSLPDDGASLEIFGVDRILEDDLRIRGDFCRDYTISVTRDDECKASLAVPYGPTPGGSLSASFIHCSHKMSCQAWQFLRESFLLDQSDFLTVAPSRTIPGVGLSFAEIPLLTFMDHPEKGRARKVASFFGSSFPVTDSVPLLPGWNVSDAKASDSPFRLVSAGPDPLSSCKAVAISSMKVDSMAGFVLFQFRNSFNVLEPVLLQGKLSVSPEVDADSAFFGRSLRRCGIVRKESFTFSISGLTARRAMGVRNLLFSPEVSVFAPQSVVLPDAALAPAPVVIDSVEGDISEEPESLVGLKIKFRLSLS